ncbi:MAG TPA: peptide chain release factor N(5)-glutamine methyltransferase, partial [Candidatus Krumholzibacteria bacterium]|nr:peptide chain release factor N(5)-glutamine methyltransferase [Candidatus Krumholzibacteria bacterium]
MAKAKAGSWTPLELIRVSAEYLADQGVPSPRLDAELLLAHVLQLDRLQLYLQHERPLIREELDRYRELIRRRARREPLQLLTGSARILDLDFMVAPGVFIPRPETETLIEVVKTLPEPSTMVEVGLGSGAVGISLLVYWPKARLVGFELSETAARVSRSNAEKHGVAERMEIVEGDAYAESLRSRWGGCELVVSNPPYIAEGEELEPEVIDHDPKEALFAGPDGLEEIRKLCAAAAVALTPGGWLAFEHGWDQESQVALILAQGPFE